MPGATSGSTILRNSCHSVAPSTFALLDLLGQVLEEADEEPDDERYVDEHAGEHDGQLGVQDTQTVEHDVERNGEGYRGKHADEQDPVGHRLFQAEAEAAARDDVGRADAGEKRDDERAERGLKAVHDRLTEVFRGEQLREVHSGERLRDKSDMASHLVGRTDRHGEQPVDREQRDHQQNCTSDCLRSRSDPLFTFHMISSFIEQESVSCIITILWTKRACAARRERPSAGALRCRRSAGR